MFYPVLQVKMEVSKRSPAGSLLVAKTAGDPNARCTTCLSLRRFNLPDFLHKQVDWATTMGPGAAKQ
jgi:hypothetical protein